MGKKSHAKRKPVEDGKITLIASDFDTEDSDLIKAWKLNDWKQNKVPTITRTITMGPFGMSERKLFETTCGRMIDSVTGQVWRDGRCMASGYFRMVG